MGGDQHKADFVTSLLNQPPVRECPALHPLTTMAIPASASSPRALLWREPGRSTSSLGRRGRTACEFQREVGGRAAGQRGLLHDVGGACADGALQTDLQPGQTAQLAGLPVARAWCPRACRPCPRACRTNITGGTNIGGRSELTVRYDEASLIMPLAL